MSDPPTARSRVSLPAWRAILPLLRWAWEEGRRARVAGAPPSDINVSARRASAAVDRLGVTKREQRIADLKQEIERLQRTEEAIVVATGVPRERGCPPWVVLGVKPIQARGVRST
jgi:hypothetical protein